MERADFLFEYEVIGFSEQPMIASAIKGSNKFLVNVMERADFHFEHEVICISEQR